MNVSEMIFEMTGRKTLKRLQYLLSHSPVNKGGILANMLEFRQSQITVLGATKHFPKKSKKLHYLKKINHGSVRGTGIYLFKQI